MKKLLKNKRGQKVMVGIMIGIMVFIIAIIFITPLKDFAIDARDSNSLDCTNTSISTGQQMSCLLVDVTPFYITGLVIFTGLSFMGGGIALSKLKK